MPDRLGEDELFEYQGKYLQTLRLIHSHLLPRTYLEIGVSTGTSLKQAKSATRAIGIDPDPRLNGSVSGATTIFPETSDAFFADHDVAALLDNRPLDVAFIDGMHHFEFAFRDFRNVERHSDRGSLVLIHDCLPPSRGSAARDSFEGEWAGDVWKLLFCLVDYRPDLHIRVVNARPTGLGIVSNLDPSSTILWDREDEIIESYLPLDWPDYCKRAPTDLHVVPNQWDDVRASLPEKPYQRRSLRSETRRARVHFSGTRTAAVIRRVTRR